MAQPGALLSVPTSDPPGQNSQVGPGCCVSGRHRLGAAGHVPRWQVRASRGRAGRRASTAAATRRPPQPRADLIRKHPFLLICSGRSLRAPGENRCSLSPDEHLGLGKWLHSALFRREKRILWLQTTLSVNILQLSARLSDDKPHAARRAANLRPYGYHFIVIFHGRNVNGRCLPQPSLTAPLSTLKRLPPRGWAGARVRPPLRGAELQPGLHLPPGLGQQPPPSGRASGGRGAGAPQAANPRVTGGQQGGQGPGGYRAPPPLPSLHFLLGPPPTGQGPEPEGQAEEGLGGLWGRRPGAPAGPGSELWPGQADDGSPLSCPVVGSQGRGGLSGKCGWCHAMGSHMEASVVSGEPAGEVA